MLRQRHIKNPAGNGICAGYKGEPAFQRIGSVAGDHHAAGNTEITEVAYVVSRGIYRRIYRVGRGTRIIGDVKSNSSQRIIDLLGRGDQQAPKVTVVS